jgi:hypothetical protein
MEPDFQNLPMPDVAHIPGINPRPNLTFLESISAYAHPKTEEKNWKTNIPWLYGIQLFNGAYYWEAHEVWETVWMNAPPNSHEKQFVQGIIHLANGLLKIKMKRPKAATKLFVRARSDLDQANMRRKEHKNLRYMGLSLAEIDRDIATAFLTSDNELPEIMLNYEL